MPLDFVKSGRGKNLLLHKGFTFSKDKELGTICYWRCTQHEKSCRARCVTMNDELKSESGNHDHVPEPAEVERRRRMNTLKDSARTSQAPPAQIIAATTANMPESVAGMFASARGLTHTVQRTRKIAGSAPREPMDLIGLQIPVSFTKTLANEEFLLFDSGPGVNRILLFSTNKNLRTLAQCDHYYADGTFKTAPTVFDQVFTIHGLKNSNTLPLVYGLLPNREEDTYTRFLTAIVNLSNTAHVNLQPVSILTDFEIGSINAFETVFPNSEKRGCYFHHTQCLWRQIQKCPNILAKYNNDADFGLYLRQVAALAFVPVQNVVAYFDTLMNTPFFQDNEVLLQPFIDYYEDVWIGRPRRGGRRPPLFRHSLWNCYQATVLRNSRTNNSVEGWNRRFNSLVGMSHPTIWKLIDKFKEEQSVTDMKMTQILAGTPADPRRKKYRDLEVRLLNIVNDFGNMPASDYLLGIAHNIGFYV